MQVIDLLCNCKIFSCFLKFLLRNGAQKILCTMVTSRIIKRQTFLWPVIFANEAQIPLRFYIITKITSVCVSENQNKSKIVIFLVKTDTEVELNKPNNIIISLQTISTKLIKGMSKHLRDKGSLTVNH